MSVEVLRISLYGCGYVGLVTAACLAEAGCEVMCYDIDEARIDDLSNGILPIDEPGLQKVLDWAMLDDTEEGGILTFTSNIEDAVNYGQIHFITVGTPLDDLGDVNVDAVYDVAESIADLATGYNIIVNKSTSPVGTMDRIRELCENNVGIEFAVNPEFLTEGKAVENFTDPDRVIIGATRDTAYEHLADVYSLLVPRSKIIRMDESSAEFTKYANNAMIATRISFINELANLADMIGVDIDMVREGLGSDSRIGAKYLHPGAGYGGSCLPKDVQGLIRKAAESGYNMELLNSVHNVNEFQKSQLYYMIQNEFVSVRDITIGIIGLSYKKDTDDIREAVSVNLINSLVVRGADVQVYDPKANAKIEELYGDDITICSDAYEAAFGARLLVIASDWDEFKELDWSLMHEQMEGITVIDGKNLLDSKEMADYGFNYLSFGKRYYIHN